MHNELKPILPGRRLHVGTSGRERSLSKTYFRDFCKTCPQGTHPLFVSRFETLRQIAPCLGRGFRIAQAALEVWIPRVSSS